MRGFREAMASGGQAAYPGAFLGSISPGEQGPMAKQEALAKTRRVAARKGRRAGLDPMDIRHRRLAARRAAS